jgi:hypothetical protein
VVLLPLAVRHHLGVRRMARDLGIFAVETKRRKGAL